MSRQRTRVVLFGVPQKVENILSQQLAAVLNEVLRELRHLQGTTRGLASFIQDGYTAKTIETQKSTAKYQELEDLPSVFRRMQMQYLTRVKTLIAKPL